MAMDRCSAEEESSRSRLAIVSQPLPAYLMLRSMVELHLLGCCNIHASLRGRPLYYHVNYSSSGLGIPIWDQINAL